MSKIQGTYRTWKKGTKNILQKSRRESRQRNRTLAKKNVSRLIFNREKEKEVSMKGDHYISIIRIIII
jgi:hypothetical protein